MRYYCEKCKAYVWMKMDGSVDSEKQNLKCAACKTAYPNVTAEAPVEKEKK